ncbi:MAG: DUF177 domain-containing protein [Eubacteriales bacterium]|nr:DUF177 domain-containing protein [Eubacteriales bacterium]
MLIDLNEVLKNDGKVMNVDAQLELAEFSGRLGRFPITDSKPVSLRIQNMGDRKLHISGSTSVTLKVPCDRCLEDVPVTLKLQFEKEADMNQSDEERRKALDEQTDIEGYNLDVDKLVCSEIFVNWPSKVLCREDCKGICSICGTNLNLGTCDCRPTDLNPQMAKIQEIFSKFKEV